MSKNDAINVMKNSYLNNKSRPLQFFFIIYKNESNDLLSKIEKKEIT